jgi:hypothetical protein
VALDQGVVHGLGSLEKAAQLSQSLAVRAKSLVQVALGPPDRFSYGLLGRTSTRKATLWLGGTQVTEKRVPQGLLPPAALRAISQPKSDRFRGLS